MCISPAQINKHCSCSASKRPARPSVRPPPPPPPSTRDRERHPSSIMWLQHSERLAQVTTSPKTERGKERRSPRAPSQRGESSLGRELCRWCFPVSNQVTTLPTRHCPTRRHPQTAPAASRRPPPPPAPLPPHQRPTGRGPN